MESFVDLDLSGAEFRGVDLTGARMRGVLLTGADIDGVIDGLTVNGVAVAPLIEAELDRRHPERVTLRPTTVEQARAALDTVTAFWAATVDGARALPAGSAHRRVDGEWSLVETLRHLVFVTDAWIGHAVLLDERPFHPLGLPPTFLGDGADLGIDPAADPTLDEVLAVRADRLGRIRTLLDGATRDDLDRTRGPNPAPGFPPPAPRTALSCLRMVFHEEWAHHRFAVRDLAALAAAPAVVDHRA